jgi:hypothetical protein
MLNIIQNNTMSQNGGGERDRTDDLYTASVTLSQLSYTPTIKLRS